MSRRHDREPFSYRRVVRAEDIEPSYAICPCGKRIRLDGPRPALKPGTIASLVAVICPRCRSEVRLDMIDA